MVKIYKNKLATFEKQICKKYGSERDSKLGTKNIKAKPKKKTKLIFQEWKRKEPDLKSEKWGTRLSNGILGFAIRQFL